jgi:hypothetical protein
LHVVVNRLVTFWPISTSDSHPKFHWKTNHFWFPLVLEGWRDHGLEGKISTTSIGQREQGQGGIMKSLGERNLRGSFSYVIFPWEGEEKDDES